jgi:hypothetical protein
MSEPIALAIALPGRPPPAPVPVWAHSPIPGLLLTCSLAGGAYFDKVTFAGIPAGHVGAAFCRPRKRDAIALRRR